MNGVKVRKKKQKFTVLRSRSRENLKFGHFMLLLCRGRQGNVQNCKTHVQSDCFVAFSLPLPSSLLKLPIVESISTGLKSLYKATRGQCRRAKTKQNKKKKQPAISFPDPYRFSLVSTNREPGTGLGLNFGCSFGNWGQYQYLGNCAPTPPLTQHKH